MKLKSIVIVFLVFILCLSCQNKSDQQKNQQLKEIYELLGESPKPDSEKVVLLSIKYNIEKTKVENVLDKYLSRHDPWYLSTKEILLGDRKTQENEYPQKNKNFQETIYELSIKYDIPQEKLASLIIDYKIWTESEKENFQ